MIEKIRLAGIDVYLTRFTPEESASGQIAAQKSAVTRLLSEIAGAGHSLCHRNDGSPYIEGFNREISISHCKGYAAVGVGGSHRIGVDIETPRATLQRVTRKFLSEQEQTRFKGDDLLLTAWTMKEALYKAIGIPGIDFANGVILPSEGSCHTEIGDTTYRLESATIGNARITTATPVTDDLIP